MLTTFSLLELPDEVVYIVLQETNFYDLLSFSMISDKCANLVEQARIRLRPFKVRIDSNGFRMKFTKQDDWEAIYEWNVEKNVCRNVNMQHAVRITLNSKKFTCISIEQTENLMTTYHLPEERSDVFRAAVEHIRFLFRINLNSIDIDSTNFVDHGIWSALSSCEYAVVNGTSRDEFLSEFLTKCRMVNGLQITGRCASFANYFEQFRTLNHLILLTPSPWFTLEHLKRASCVELTVTESSVFSEDLHEYIEEWKEDTQRKFVRITFSVSPRYNRQIISPGSWYRPGNPNVPIPDNVMISPCEKKIVRATDQAVLTIVVSSHFVRLQFSYTEE